MGCVGWSRKHLIPASAVSNLSVVYSLFRQTSAPSVQTEKDLNPITSVTESQILAFMAALHEWPDYRPNVIPNLRGALTFDCSTPLMSAEVRQSPEWNRVLSWSSLYKNSSDTCSLTQPCARVRNHTTSPFQPGGWLISLIATHVMYLIL